MDVHSSTYSSEVMYVWTRLMAAVTSMPGSRGVKVGRGGCRRAEQQETGSVVGGEKSRRHSVLSHLPEAVRRLAS